MRKFVFHMLWYIYIYEYATHSTQSPDPFCSQGQKSPETEAWIFRDFPPGHVTAAIVQIYMI